MNLTGIHHVSPVTANAKENYQFYTDVLGMRLVKKTINQDDPSVYHLFYADEIGNPGTDLTFFEIPLAGKTYEGTNSISNTSLRVPNDEALSYWLERFDRYHVTHEGIVTEFGRNVIPFRDPEGQRLTLVSDETNKGVAGGKPWVKSPVPTKYAIIGLGPSRLTVQNVSHTISVLTELLTFTHVGQYPTEHGDSDIQVFSTGEGGTGAEIHLEQRADLSPERPGRGSVHHVAFRVNDEEELHAWHDHLQKARIPNSGVVDRFYFQSLYFREANGILFELATDGPGFATDEDVNHLGESNALPPFFEDQRTQIEARLTPLDTKPS